MTREMHFYSPRKRILRDTYRDQHGVYKNKIITAPDVRFMDKELEGNVFRGSFNGCRFTGYFFNYKMEGVFSDCDYSAMTLSHGCFVDQKAIFNSFDDNLCVASKVYRRKNIKVQMGNNKEVSRVLFCSNFERSLKKPDSPIEDNKITFQPLKIYDGGLTLDFLMRVYHSENEGSEHRKEMQSSQMKIGFIPRNNYTIASGDKRQKIDRHIIYVPSGRKWQKLITTVNCLHNGLRDGEFIKENLAIDLSDSSDFLQFKIARPFNIPVNFLRCELKDYFMKATEIKINYPDYKIEL